MTLSNKGVNSSGNNHGGELNMTINNESEKTVLRLWILLRRVGDALGLCHDMLYSKYGITWEQVSVLGAIKSRGPLRPSDLALILERTPNSTSMLVDRMVKAGLVRRTRDRKDRRVVTVSLTEKSQTIVDRAIPEGWEFIHQILLPLSNDERSALVSTLEIIRCELIAYLNPEVDKAEIIKKSLTRDPGLYKRMVEKLLSSGSSN